MKDDNLAVLTGILFLVTIVALSSAVVVVKQNKGLKEMAIKQECAHYNSLDGQFEWLRKDK